MTKKRVVITGLGVVSPLGNNLQTTWDKLLAGKSGVVYLEDEGFTDFPTRIAGTVKDFNPDDFGINPKDARRMARFLQLAVAASKEAVADSGIDIAANPEMIGVGIGSGVGGIDIMAENAIALHERGVRKVSPFTVPMMINDMAAGIVSIETGAKGPNFCVTTACASGTHTIGSSYKFIQDGQAVAMITGGSEAAVTPLGMAGFCAAKSLSTRNDDPEKASRPFDNDRDGFVMGEGAGILVLEELEHAKARGAKIYAELVGFGASGDAYHLTAPPEDGNGAARAMKMALKDAGIAPEEVDYINAHGTSTKLNDQQETNAIKTVFGKAAYKVMVGSTKSMTGHLLGAAGGIEAVFVAKVLETGLVPPTINYDTPDVELGLDLDYVPNVVRKADVKVAMSNSFGFGGHNGVIVMKKYVN
ncbi:MAG: beta-ketoacyl-ACP synthase II [Candidatus Margulisbacteria bacterium]|nr:beta-ketoacyl-ACP synthase II [Candidatus Margulisiibacteriota bacterium]